MTDIYLTINYLIHRIRPVGSTVNQMILGKSQAHLSP